MGFLTDEIPTDQAASVPSGRTLAKDFHKPKEGAGIVIIKRDSGVAGSACPIRIFLNTIPVADIWPTEKTELYLPGGQYALSASYSGKCLNRGNTAEAAIAIESSKNMAFRISITSYGKMFIQPGTF